MVAGEGMTGCGWRRRKRKRGGGGRYLLKVGGGWRRGKGSGREHRDWLMGDLRQGPSLLTKAALSTEHQAACSIAHPLRYRTYLGPVQRAGFRLRVRCRGVERRLERGKRYGVLGSRHFLIQFSFNSVQCSAIVRRSRASSVDFWY